MTISRGTTRIIFSDSEIMRVPSKTNPARDDKHGATTFTDYFVLLRSDRKWLIANKVYHAQR